MSRPELRFSATIADRKDYETWFSGSGGSLSSNSIPMDGARAFFVQSGLPNDTLSQVWRVANRANLSNGALNFADFCIAANLLLQIARKLIDQPPPSLPSSFYDAADAFATIRANQQQPHFDPFPSAPTNDLVPGNTTAAPPPQHRPDSINLSASNSILRPNVGTPPLTESHHTTISPVPAHRTGISPAPAHRLGVSPVPTHHTGSSILGIPSASARSVKSPPPIPVPRSNDIPELPAAGSFTSASTLTGSIVPSDKQALYASYFAQVDTSNKGYATGPQCFDMFMKSGLPNDDLSKIWNLVATNGQLNKDTFVLAMHLIFEKLAGKAIPSHLPPHLSSSLHVSDPVHVNSTGASSLLSGNGAASMKSAPSISNLPTPSLLGESSGAPSPKSNGPTHSFEDIIATGAPTSELHGIPSFSAQPSSYSFNNASGSISATASMSGVPQMGFSSNTFSKGPGLLSSSGVLSSATMSSLPAAALPEAKELNDLITKTDSLSTQRIEATTSLNRVSIERQNLQIRLDQARVTHDAEERMLKEMKVALESELKSINDLKEQLCATEKQRAEMLNESRQLSEQIRADRSATEELRNKLVSTNLEISGMRGEINSLREQAKQQRDAKNDVSQTVQNVEEARGLVQSTLDRERQEIVTRGNIRNTNPPQFTTASSSPAANAMALERLPAPSNAQGPTARSTNESPVVSSRAFSLVDSAPTGGSLASSPNSTKAIKSPSMDQYMASGGSTTPFSAVGMHGTSMNYSALQAVLPNPSSTLAQSMGMPGNTSAYNTSISNQSIESTMSSFPSPSQLPVVPSSPSSMADYSPPKLTNTAVDPLAAIPEDLKKQFEADFDFGFPNVRPNNSSTPPSTSPQSVSKTGRQPNTVSGAPNVSNDFDPFAFAMDFPPPSNRMSAVTPSSNSPVANRATTPEDPMSAFDPFAGFATSNPSSGSSPQADKSNIFPNTGPSQGTSDMYTMMNAHHSPSSTRNAVVLSDSPSPYDSKRADSPVSGADPLSTVVAMGFTRNQSISALERYDFDAEKAINFLVDSTGKQ